MAIVTDYQLPIKQNNELFRLKLNGILADAYARIGGIYAPQEFGVTGEDDPTVDDTAAFNALVSAMPSGGVIYIPAGDYRLKGWDLTKPVEVWMAPGATLRNYDQSDNTNGSNYILGIKANDVSVHGGAIRGAVSTSSTAPATYYCVRQFVDGSDNPYQRTRIADCFIEGGRYNIYISECSDMWVERNRLISAWDNGVSGPEVGKRFWFTENSVESTYDGCGIRTGALTDTEACEDLVIAFNQFYLCGTNTPQDGIDVATANGARTKIIGNTVRDCGDGIEVKVNTAGTGFTDLLIALNTLTSSGSAYDVGIRLNVPASGGLQDHLRRVVIEGNYQYHAVATNNLGIYVGATADVTVQNNVALNLDQPIYIDSRSTGLEQNRCVVRGNRTFGLNGILINGESGSYIDDLVIADNDCHYVSDGIRVLTDNTGWGLRRPRITGNRLRCTDGSSAGRGMRLSGLSGAVISGNDILALGIGIEIIGTITNAAIVVTGNTIDSSDGTDGDNCISIDSTTGTIEIYDNSLRPRDGYRGWADAAAGATVLGGTNKRGVASAIPTNAGALGDTYDDSTPAAGATKWVCTTAGASGAAVWTAQ